jgi:hypothetical protein
MVCVPLVIPYQRWVCNYGFGNKPELKCNQHGRLEPGKMFLVDMNEGRIIEDDEIKDAIVTSLSKG